MDLLRTIGLAWTQYRAFQAGLAELKSCSADELSRRGLSSGDIPRIAYAAAERRVAAMIGQRRACGPDPVRRAQTVAS